MRVGFAVVLVIIVVATLFIIFVPVVPETTSVRGCLFGYTCPGTVDYYGSISFHFFNVGMVYFSCNGFQMVMSARGSPIICYSGMKIQSTQSH